MAVVQDEILDAFITELRERALSEFRHSEKENQDRYDSSLTVNRRKKVQFKYTFRY